MKMANLTRKPRPTLLHVVNIPLPRYTPNGFSQAKQIYPWIVPEIRNSSTPVVQSDRLCFPAQNHDIVSLLNEADLSTADDPGDY